MVAKKQVPAMSAQDLSVALSKHGVHLFHDRAGMATNQAQRNLHGRTMWAENASLVTRKASIVAVNVLDDGLLLAVVEKAQKTANAADGYVFRPVFFDVFGNIVDTIELSEAPETQKGAMSELWKRADAIDSVKTTIEGAKAKKEQMEQALEKFTELVDEME